MAKALTPLLPVVLQGASVDALRGAARECKNCDLWERATQTVFGEGPKDARLVLIGEQPGDHEDLENHPFVGPAGRLLDGALEAAGIDRAKVYVTNAVKHFKWTPQGKRRLHEKPNAREIAACKMWLQAELAALKPEALVCLGATAAQALFGNAFRVTKERGRLFAAEGVPQAMATVHPSSILRQRDEVERNAELARFTDDLRLVARFA